MLGVAQGWLLGAWEGVAALLTSYTYNRTVAAAMRTMLHLVAFATLVSCVFAQDLASLSLRVVRARSPRPGVQTHCERAQLVGQWVGRPKSSHLTPVVVMATCRCLRPGGSSLQRTDRDRSDRAPLLHAREHRLWTPRRVHDSCQS